MARNPAEQDYPLANIGGRFSIPYSELQFQFCRASGPGGQFVNRTDSAVQLRFDAAHSTSLPEDVRERLLVRTASQMTSDGFLLIDAQQFRSQQRNKEAAIRKLALLLETAAKRPKARKATKPTSASRVKRLETKRRDSQTKQNRRFPKDSFHEED